MFAEDLFSVCFCVSSLHHHLFISPSTFILIFDCRFIIYSGSMESRISFRLPKVKINFFFKNVKKLSIFSSSLFKELIESTLPSYKTKSSITEVSK